MANQVVIDIIAETKNLTQGINEANKQLGTLDSSLSSVSSKDMSSLGKSMTAGITMPLLGIAAAGVKTAADFDVTMSSLGVNAGIAGKQLDGLRNLAIKLGADTVFSANEAAGAMLELSKSGMSPANIQGGALAATLNLAATEGIGLADAATIMANTMNTFGLSAKDSKKVTDLLAAGAVASTASVTDLAGGLKYVGSTAAMLKIPLDTTVTSLAAMNNAGIDATTAGTSLNRFMLGLIPTTRKAAEEMDSLGISFQNSDGTMKTMPEIIGVLKTQMAGLSDAEQVAALKTMFGVEGMRAASTLMKLNTDGYKDLNDQVNKNGVASELANARMSGMAGAMETLKGSAETAALKIGEALAPAIKLVAGILTTAINLFTALPGPVQNVIVGIAAFAAILGPIAWAMGAIANSTNLATAATLAKAAADKVATASQWLFNAALSANPIGLVIIAIAALIAIIVLVAKNWDTITSAVSSAWNAIKDFANNAITKITGFKDSFVSAFTSIKDKALSVVSTVLNAFLGLPGSMVSVGKDLMDGLVTGIVGKVTSVVNAVKNAVTSVINGAKSLLGIKSPSKVFASIGKNVVQGLANGINTAKDLAATASSNLGNTVTSNFGLPQLSSASASSAPINITINAGLGTDPYALGREVNNALNKYGKVSNKIIRG